MIRRKEELIHKTTQMLVDYLSEAARPHTMVLIETVPDGGFGRADEVFVIPMRIAPKTSPDIVSRARLHWRVLMNIRVQIDSQASQSHCVHALSILHSIRQIAASSARNRNRPIRNLALAIGKDFFQPNTVNGFSR